ncbi:hypothetical protein DFH28DRAFT_1083410 [Melampsora americana]|nr:hypothetical protein DFH28DRAFT_1083410 [Melampsora americana]
MLLVKFLVSVFLISSQSIARPLEQVSAALSTCRDISNVPLLRWEYPQVDRAINSKRLLLVLDYHGTIMGHNKQDHPKLLRILRKISQTSDLVITSGGPAKELLEQFHGIPRITLASDAPPGIQEQVKRIGQLCNQVVKYGYAEDKQLTPYPDREYSYQIRIGPKVDYETVSLLHQTVEQRLKDEGLTNWKIELPLSRRILNIQLENQDKTELAQNLIQKANAEGHEFDYVIGMGDSDGDEPLLEYLNQQKFLSIVVHNFFHKRVDTAPQFLLPNAEDAQDFLEHIADQRIAKIEKDN